MQQGTLDLFLQICKIPHASKHTEALCEWIIQFAKQCGARVECDAAGNIHCIKGDPIAILLCAREGNHGS